MKKTLKKKLTLNRETLRTMASDPLAVAVGGAIPRSQIINTCQSCYQLCSVGCPTDGCTDNCPTSPGTVCC